MARIRLLALTVCALYLLAFSSGCLRLNANIDVLADGSSAVDIEIGMSEALLSMNEGGEDPFAEMKQNPPEGDWKIEDFTDEGWKGVRIKGVAPAGGEVFPKGGDGPGANVDVVIVKRLFSTEYTIKGLLPLQSPAPPQTGDDSEARLPEGRIVFTQNAEAGEGEGETNFDPGALMGLMGAMGQGPSISFTVGLPGQMVETSGAINADGKAEWTMGMQELTAMSDSAGIEIYARSILMNQQSIGRLADKLAAESHLDDSAALIAEYVGRGILPNPPKDDPLSAGLDAAAYDAAISLYVALDMVLGEAMTDRVVQGLKLNADSVTARQLKNAWEDLGEIQEEELIEVGAQAIIKHMKMFAE